MVKTAGEVFVWLITSAQGNFFELSEIQFQSLNKNQNPKGSDVSPENYLHYKLGKLANVTQTKTKIFLAS